MEELKTTEALDREILEDARKKAYKILKTADDTITAQNKDWEKRTTDAVNSIRKAYADRIKKTEEETYARLSLDKRRLRSECAEVFLKRASEDFLRSRTREELLAVLKMTLLELLLSCARNGDSFADSGGRSKPELRYSAMSIAEIRTLMKQVAAILEKETCSLPGGWNPEDIDYRETGPEAVHQFPAVVINTSAMMISASVEAAALVMIRDNRAELASALLGKGVLDD